jgi:hypothetical protein
MHGRPPCLIRHEGRLHDHLDNARSLHGSESAATGVRNQGRRVMQPSPGPVFGVNHARTRQNPRSGSHAYVHRIRGRFHSGHHFVADSEVSSREAPLHLTPDRCPVTQQSGSQPHTRSSGGYGSAARESAPSPERSSAKRRVLMSEPLRVPRLDDRHVEEWPLVWVSVSPDPRAAMRWAVTTAACAALPTYRDARSSPAANTASTTTANQLAWLALGRRSDSCPRLDHSVPRVTAEGCCRAPADRDRWKLHFDVDEELV